MIRKSSTARRLLLTAAAAMLTVSTAHAEIDLDFDTPHYRNGKIDIRPVGRLQTDFLVSSGLPSSRTDDFDVRRARFGVLGRYGRDWRTLITADVDGGFDLQDLSIEYRGLPVWIEGGRILEPFGLADQSSSRNLPLIERAQPTVLGTDYGFGVAANLRGEIWGLTAGVFGKTGNEQLDGRDRAVTARLTALPFRSDQWLVHLGAGSTLRKPGEANLRYSGAPETRLISGLSVRSPRILDAERAHLSNAEVAVRRGPLLVAAEYRYADVSRSTPGAPDASFDGYYVEASYALTGERRDYSTRRGTFGGLRPKRPLFGGGYGAVEVAARFSQSDFTDDFATGEEGQVAAVGVNWTPINRVRLQLNVLQIEQTRNAVEEDDTVVQLRTELNL